MKLKQVGQGPEVINLFLSNGKYFFHGDRSGDTNKLAKNIDTCQKSIFVNIITTMCSRIVTDISRKPVDTFIKL